MVSTKTCMSVFKSTLSQYGECHFLTTYIPALYIAYVHAYSQITYTHMRPLSTVRERVVNCTNGMLFYFYYDIFIEGKKTDASFKDQFCH